MIDSQLHHQLLRPWHRYDIGNGSMHHRQPISWREVIAAAHQYLVGDVINVGG